MCLCMSEGALQRRIARETREWHETPADRSNETINKWEGGKEVETFAELLRTTKAAS